MTKVDFVGHSPFHCSISENAKKSPLERELQPQRGEVTGFNIVNNDLKHATWGNKETERLLSKKKCVSKSMKEFAQWNKPEQFTFCRKSLNGFSFL